MIRRTCIALLLVALVAAVPTPAAAAPADSDATNVLDAWWGQLSDLVSQLFGVFAGSTTEEEEEEPPPTDGTYGMGIDPDGRVPTDDSDESTSLRTLGDPEAGSLLDPNG